jgi:hypothetical protein
VWVGQETVVRSSCLRCGTVDLSALDVTVYAVSGAEPTYSFHCPRCRALVRKSTTIQAMRLLAGAGSTVVDLPAAATEGSPPAPATGPTEPLTDDDLIALGRALAGTDTLAAFAGPRRPTPPGSPAGR